MSDEGRIVLTLLLKTEKWQEDILEKRFRVGEQIKNALIGIEMKKLKRMEQDPEYIATTKELIEIHNKYQALLSNRTNEAAKKKEQKKLYDVRKTLMHKYGLIRIKDEEKGISGRTMEQMFMDDVAVIQKHFSEHVQAVVAQQIASDVARAFDKYFFGNGKHVRFIKRGTLMSMAGKKNNGITYENGIVIWAGGGSKNAPYKKRMTLKMPLAFKLNDYETEMLKKEIAYCRILRKWGKTCYKYYIQITLKGSASNKGRVVGHERVGIDIGPQTIAFVADSDADLLELADQVNPNHKRMLHLQRKMDRSRRDMNPDNYNPDGTVKRGKKVWVKSNRYKKMEAEVRYLHRKNADIRKMQHNMLANRILALGNEIYIEEMNFKGLQSRAKNTERQEKESTVLKKDGTAITVHKYKRKKRFGKSLANKAPSAFVTILSQKADASGGMVKKINTREFKASQLDHTSGEYTKRELWERDKQLSNGDVVQRDLYSAFLLQNSNEEGTSVIVDECNSKYGNYKDMHDRVVERIRKDGKTHPMSFGNLCEP